MGKPITVFSLAAVLAALPCLLPARALADDAGGPASISGMLSGSEIGFHAEGLRPSGLSFLTAKPGVVPRYYARVLAGLEMLDGGPNISGYQGGSPSYRDAFNIGMSVNLEVWCRFTPNIYLTFSVVGAQFPGEKEFDYPNGDTLSLSNFTVACFTIGGAFAAPISSVLPGEERMSDEEGLLGTFKFDLGLCVQDKITATVESSPIPADVGRTYDYWKARAGFAGSVAFGLEYRVGVFSVFLDFGVRTYGRPVSATTPAWQGDAQTVISYALRVGVSYRF